MSTEYTESMQIRNKLEQFSIIHGNTSVPLMNFRCHMSSPCEWNFSFGWPGNAKFCCKTHDKIFIFKPSKKTD